MFRSQFPFDFFLRVEQIATQKCRICIVIIPFAVFVRAVENCCDVFAVGDLVVYVEKFLAQAAIEIGVSDVCLAAGVSYAHAKGFRWVSY